jgi:nicotinate-nucleotide adenylyltransferase
MVIGVFGGTFDPVHIGHLVLAEHCREAAGLDAVWFLPSYQPPHKGREVTAFPHRVAMTALAIAGQDSFRVETLERDLPPPSYTANTLAALITRHPGHEFKLVVGADCLPDLPKWHEPQRVLAQAGLVVARRPGVEPWDRARVSASLAMPVESVRLQFVDSPLMEIASRELRQRVAAGRSIRFMVPTAVEEYVRTHRLYHGQ